MERRGENYPPAGEPGPGPGMRSEPMTPPRETTGRVMEPTVTRADIYGVMTPGMAAMPRDITRWGPIFAGFFVALSVIVLLGVLGAAFGLQVGGSVAGTGTAIWGAVMLIVGFFVGGWVTGRTASITGATSGWMHGVVVWSLTTSVLLFLGAFGLANAIGAAIGGGLTTLPPGTTVPPATGIALAQGAAWGTFIALVLGLIASAIGGWVGGSMAESNVVTPTPPQVQAR